jgi:hypothetical protein
MEQDVVWIFGLVRVIFIKQIMPRVFRISQVSQFVPQRFHLLVREDPKPADISLLMEKVDLIRFEAERIAIFIERLGKEGSDGMMVDRKILHKGPVYHLWHLPQFAL